MPRLNIIICGFFEPFYSLASWFKHNREALSSRGFLFQGVNNCRTGLPDLHQLIYEMVWSRDTPKISAILDDLSIQTHDGHDLIWLTNSIRASSLTKLRGHLAGHDTFAGYTVCPWLIVQNQSQSVCRLIGRFWKQRTPESYMAQLAHPETSLHYAPYLAQLQNTFGAENCRFVPFTGSYGDFGSALGDALNLTGLFSALQPDIFPETFVGLDVTAAAMDFPFDVLKKDDTRRQRFYGAVAKVEKEEGYEVFRHLPKGMAQKLADSFQDTNAAFIAEHGSRYEFLNNWPDVPDMPENVPELTAAECHKFVQAMDGELRTDLLEFFRLRLPLDAGEHILAKSLEEYRQSHFSAASSIAPPARNPVLSVLTMAYNHKDYILECMESVAAQETDFPIEHIIVDDCSDDGTQDIIDNFAATHAHVRPIYFPYRSGGRNVRALFNACRSEYAALCDGDDYFTEPEKLQKQVVFLKKNTDCSICFHPVVVAFENGARENFIYPVPQQLPRWPNRKYHLADLLKTNIIQTNSAVYRWRFRDGLPDWFRSDISPGDWYWHLLHAETGKAGLIPEVMAVYRRHDKAFYRHAFVDRVEHRRERGMAELKAYDTINRHFNDRYFRYLSSLAFGVFDDFLALKGEGDKAGLFETALERYPKFGLPYVRYLKGLCKNRKSGNSNASRGTS